MIKAHECIYREFLQKVFLAAGEIDAAKDKFRLYYLGSSQNYSEKNQTFSSMFARFCKRIINDPDGITKINVSDISSVFGPSSNQKSYFFSAKAAPKLIKKYILTFYRLTFENTIFFTVSEDGGTEGLLTYSLKHRCVNKRIADIYYLSYGNHCVKIHDGESIANTFSLSFAGAAQTLLHHGGFVRCYKNCVVNMSKIQSIDGDFFILLNGERIPIPKRRSKEIKAAYEDFLLAKEF